MLRSILLFSLIGLIAVSGLAQSPENRTEVWPEFTINYDPATRFRLMLAVRKETGEETPDSTIETTATVIFRIKPIVRRLIADNDYDSEKNYKLSLAANYEFSRSLADDASVSTEHKFMIDATPRYNLRGNILMQDRNRLEFRWVNGTYDFWYRNRLRVEKKFQIGKVRFIPYASGEVIWTKNENAWNRNQLSAGVEIPIIRKRTSLEMYFTRKNCDTCSYTDVNAIGFNVHMFFGVR